MLSSDWSIKVMAHAPTTFPEVGSKGTVLDVGKEAFFAVSALYTESSPLVRDLEVKRRNCIFADERDVPNASITVFKFYSQVEIDQDYQISCCYFLRKIVSLNVEPGYYSRNADVCHIIIQDWMQY